MYPVTHSRSAQPVGTRRKWAFPSRIAQKIPRWAAFYYKVVSRKNVSGHWEEITSTFNHLRKIGRYRNPGVGLTNSNGKCNFLPLFPSPVLSAPPQAVSVVQLTNSSSISVSWEPPPHNSQSGIVLEYKVSRKVQAPIWHPLGASAVVGRRLLLINNVCAPFSLAAPPRLAV